MSEATLKRETERYYAEVYKNSKNLHSCRVGRGVGEALGSQCPHWSIDQVVAMASNSKQNPQLDTFSYRVGLLLGFIAASHKSMGTLTKHHFELLKSQA